MQARAWTSAPSVSISYERSLKAYLQTRGLPAASAGNDGGLCPASRVDGRSFGQALMHSGRVLGDATTGLAFGLCVGGAGFGLLGVAAATAPTLRDSVRQLQRFESLTSTLGHMTVRQRSRHLISLCWQPAAPDTPPAVAEALLAGWVSFGRYLLDERVDVVEASFAHCASAPRSAYEAALGCPVRFEADRHSVTLAAELLDAQPRFAEATISGALDAWLDRCTLGVATPPQLQPTARRVAQALAGGLPLANANEDAIATELQLNRRTLQRRLTEEGASFRALLDAARAQHAIVGVLRGGVSLAQLGADIGFDEQSSLCRAFRRWTGYAPLAVKSRLQPMFSELRPVTD
jgi:AraC-like DNA-binding protein